MLTMTVEVATHNGRFQGWWYVLSLPGGYLWRDGVWRTICWNGQAQDGVHGYYRTEELARSAAANHKDTHVGRVE